MKRLLFYILFFSSISNYAQIAKVKISSTGFGLLIYDSLNKGLIGEIPPIYDDVHISATNWSTEDGSAFNIPIGINLRTWNDTVFGAASYGKNTSINFVSRKIDLTDPIFVIKNGKKGVVNQDGEILIPVTYDSLYFFGEPSLSNLKTKNKFLLIGHAKSDVQLLKTDGTILIPFGFFNYFNLNFSNFEKESLLYSLLVDSFALVANKAEYITNISQDTVHYSVDEQKKNKILMLNPDGSPLIFIVNYTKNFYFKGGSYNLYNIYTHQFKFATWQKQIVLKSNKRKNIFKRYALSLSNPDFMNIYRLLETKPNVNFKLKVGN